MRRLPIPVSLMFAATLLALIALVASLAFALDSKLQLLIAAVSALFVYLSLGVAVLLLLKRVSSLGDEVKTLGRRVKVASKQNATIQRSITESIVLPKLVRRFERARSNSRLRELSVMAIFPDLYDIAVPLGAVDPKTGHPNQAEYLFVCGIAKAREARDIFEFGTWFGRTSYHLAKVLPDSRILTLDLPEEQGAWAGSHQGKLFKGTPQEEQITQILCDSREFDPSPYRGKFDLIWIDGGHSYEVVKNDTEKAFEMLAPGGVILWHDYASKSPDVVQYVEEITQDRALFRLADTSLLLHMDGVDPEAFEPAKLPAARELVAACKAARRK